MAVRERENRLSAHGASNAYLRSRSFVPAWWLTPCFALMSCGPAAIDGSAGNPAAPAGAASTASAGSSSTANAGGAPVGSGGTASGTTATEQAFADSLVAAFCGGLRTCCESQARPFSGPDCETNLRALLAARVVTDPRQVFDPAAAAECLANVEAALPTCAGVEREPCDRVYGGTIATGGACEATSHCAPVSGARVYCLQVCKAERRATEGQACVRTCRAQGDCFALDDAAPSLVGTAVTDYGECYVDDGLLCLQQTCQRAPAVGEPCHDGFFCTAGAVCESGSCVAAPPPGGSCVTQCGPGQLCLGGICDPLGALGEECFGSGLAADDQCASGFCRNGVCSATATIGAPHGDAECTGDVHL